MGRWKDDGTGKPVWDANDSGPDQIQGMPAGGPQAQPQQPSPSYGGGFQPPSGNTGINGGNIPGGGFNPPNMWAQPDEGEKPGWGPIKISTHFQPGDGYPHPFENGFNVGGGQGQGGATDQGPYANRSTAGDFTPNSDAMAWLQQHGGIGDIFKGTFKDGTPISNPPGQGGFPTLPNGQPDWHQYHGQIGPMDPSQTNPGDWGRETTMPMQPQPGGGLFQQLLQRAQQQGQPTSGGTPGLGLLRGFTGIF